MAKSFQKKRQNVRWHECARWLRLRIPCPLHMPLEEEQPEDEPEPQRRFEREPARREEPARVQEPKAVMAVARAKGQPPASMTQVIERQIIKILQGETDDAIGEPVPATEAPGVEVPSFPGVPETQPGEAPRKPEEEGGLIPEVVPGIAIDFPGNPNIEPGRLPFPLPSRGPGVKPVFRGQEVEQWARQLNTQFQSQPHIQMPQILREKESLPMRTAVPSLQQTNMSGYMGLVEEIFTTLLQRQLKLPENPMVGLARVISTAVTPENRWIGVAGIGALGAGTAALLSGSKARGGTGFFINYANRINALTGQIGGVFEGF